VSIHVARPGLLSTVQDLGRHGEQHLGVCPGGAMDPVALALANALVGNPVHAAALEITIIGPELRFEHVTLVALCGAEFQGGLPRNRPVLLAPGRACRSAGRPAAHAPILPWREASTSRRCSAAAALSCPAASAGWKDARCGAATCCLCWRTRRRCRRSASGR